MDSPQSVVSPFKSLSVTSNEPKKNSIGILDVHIHQARDIHNICIYHKQDVYAKICLTSDPENTVSTQTINGGGRNPVFNESLKIDVRTLDASLKCEIWMLSRVRNYLEDQLLGFAVIPLSEIIVMNGKLDKEFSLSSTDLYHSPSGFVQLSINYSGSSPELMVISKIPALNAADSACVEESEQETSEYDKLEFPDPKIANENQIMVTEYFGMTDSASETENRFSSETVGGHEESFSANSVESEQIPKTDSPISVSSNGIRPVISQSSETGQEEPISPLKEAEKDHEKKKNDDFTAEHDPDREKKGDEKSEGSNGRQKEEEAFKPVSFKVEPPEEKVVQQDIVDMYMKSMQQFTESLAKMKLPMEVGNDLAKSETSSSSDAATAAQTPKTPGSRVFYGSRAFF